MKSLFVFVRPFFTTIVYIYFTLSSNWKAALVPKVALRMSMLFKDEFGQKPTWKQQCPPGEYKLFVQDFKFGLHRLLLLFSSSDLCDLGSKVTDEKSC